MTTNIIPDTPVLDTSAKPRSVISLLAELVRNKWVGRIFIVIGALCLFAAVYMLGTKLISNSSTKQRFAMIDLASVVAIKEREFSDLLMKKDASDQDRVRAYELVQKMGTDLEKALKQIKQQCDCTLLVSSAIVSANVDQLPDYTSDLKTALGIASSATIAPASAPTVNAPVSAKP
jgi:hypothetical protein